MINELPGLVIDTIMAGNIKLRIGKNKCRLAQGNKGLQSLWCQNNRMAIQRSWPGDAL